MLQREKLEMFDAYGKFGDGILMGNIKWFGNYHECAKVYAPSELNTTIGNFHGQYCTLTFSVNLGVQEIPLTWGICIPDSCNLIKAEMEVHNLIKTYTDLFPFLDNLHLPIKLDKTTCQPVSKEWTLEALVVLYILAFLVSLVIIGSLVTLCEHYTKRTLKMNVQADFHKESAINSNINGETTSIKGPAASVLFAPQPRQVISGHNKFAQWENVKLFFKCFCAISNTKKLFSFGNPNELFCLHGIRFFTFCWVVIVHILGIFIKILGNPVEAMEDLDNWPAQILSNGMVGVDSFFLMSGFLLAQQFFKTCSKKGLQTSWIYFYVHRYVRLTPAYMMVLGMYTTLYYYMASGPFGVTDELEPLCKKYWWWNLLYINNFLNDWCMGWTWYLAADMQFYIISPLFLISFWRWPKIGYLLTALFIAITVISNFAITYHYNVFSGLGTMLPLTIDVAIVEEKYNEFINKVYVKPYTRISPYVIGIALAYFMFKRNQEKKSRKINVFVLGLGWTLSTCIALACIFSLYHQKDTLILNSVFNALNHTSYSFSLAWIVFVCCTEEHQGIVNRILSCKVFVPLSRLTYTAYLTHVIIIRGYLNGLQRSIYYSHETMVLVYLGMLVVIYSVAYLAYLFFEAPFIKLEQFVMSKLRSS